MLFAVLKYSLSPPVFVRSLLTFKCTHQICLFPYVCLGGCLCVWLYLWIFLHTFLMICRTLWTEYWLCFLVKKVSSSAYIYFYNFFCRYLATFTSTCENTYRLQSCLYYYIHKYGLFWQGIFELHYKDVLVCIIAGNYGGEDERCFLVCCRRQP